MSQQLNDRRQSVLGPGRSQLPMPSSVARRAPTSGIPMPPPSAPAPMSSSRSMRQSLAGPPQRVLAAPVAGPSAPSTNPRMSVVRAQAGPASTIKRGLPPGRDPRDLRSQQFKQTTLQTVIEFLRSVEYQGDLTMKTLSSLPAREVQSLVKALYSCIEPSFRWGVPYNAGLDYRGPPIRFEDQFLPMLKSLGYPYADSITKATLQTPGSMPNMPHTLGILHWLVRGCKSMFDVEDYAPKIVIEAQEVPEEFDDDEHAHALFFEYNRKAYDLFLSGADSFEVEDKAMEDRYAQRDAAVIQSNAAMTAELDHIKRLYATMSQEESPAVAGKAARESIERDILKLRSTIQKDGARIQRYQADVESSGEKIARETEEIEFIKQERIELQARVDEQGISPEEAMQMTRDRESLTRSTEDTKQKVEQAKRVTEDLEIKWAKRVDHIEAVTDEYSALVMQTDLESLLPPTHQGVDFNITLELAKDAIVMSEDLNDVIRPALLAVADAARDQREQVMEKHIRDEDELARMANRIEQLEEDYAHKEGEVDAMLTEADEVREAGQVQMSQADAEAARLEKEISSARASAKSHGLAVKTRLQALHIEREEQTQKIDRLRDETLKAIARNTGEMAAFKIAAADAIEGMLIAAQSH